MAPRQRRKWSQRTKSGLLTQSVWCNLESENEKNPHRSKRGESERLKTAGGDETGCGLRECGESKLLERAAIQCFIFSRHVSKSIDVLFLARVS